MRDGSDLGGQLKPGRLRIALVGAGRLGAPIAAALARCGHAIVAASAVSEASISRLEALLPGVPRVAPQDAVKGADLVLLAVPDDDLVAVCEGLVAVGALTQGQLIAHFSGVHGLAALDSAARVGAIPLAIHPAMTFTGTSLDLERIVGATFAVTAPAPFVPIAQALVVEVGGEPIILDDANRALYHAALVHGANHVVTLVAQASSLLASAGVEDPGRVLSPLVHASVDGALSDVAGSINSLTGPVVRGDAATVAAHVRALAHRPDALAAYRAAARATADSALAGGRIGPDDYAAVLVALGQETA